jgi:pimeloyl-ACP methyl ester carboxylesterase
VLQKIFFPPTESSQAAGAAFIERLMRRAQDREPISGPAVAQAQMAAFREWELVSGERFADLQRIRHPTLVVNGVYDEMIPVSNSYWLSAQPPNAVLLTYPDSGTVRCSSSMSRSPGRPPPSSPRSRSSRPTEESGERAQENTPMSKDTHETVPTQFVQAGNVQFAYRRFGPRTAVPLLLCNYFAANMDDWDPKVTDGLAAGHDVILFDYPGIGRSSGETPSTVAALTENCVAFCRAIGLTRFNVVGFSLGGMIAQQIGAEYPDLLRRIILLGTGPRGGEGMVFDELSVDELDDRSALLMNAFFTQSEASQAAGRAYMERLKSRSVDHDAPVSKLSALAELAAIREWGVIPAKDRFAMLGKIRQPTLIVHGAKDVVVMPINAFLLAERLPNAQLIMDPDASHGAQSQYADVFLQHVKLFLQ